MRERLEVATGPRPGVIAASSLVGVVVLVVVWASVTFGGARTAQVILTLLIPSLVMYGFWRLARSRIQAHDAEVGAILGREAVTNRSLGGFLAGVAHELTPHPERTSLRAEALATAVEYRDADARIEVAVPDVVVVTDPLFLRQLIHLLVDNALRHGGSRIAIWAASKSGGIELAVSDDGPGMPSALADRAFQRTVDLGSSRAPDAGAGLSIARALSDALGAGIAYKRDPTWSHFTMSLPLEAAPERREADRRSLSAGVG